MIFSQVCINLSPALQGGWVGGRRGREGRGGAGRGGGGEGGGKTPQVNTRGHHSSPTTQQDRRDTIPVEGRTPGWLHPNWRAPQVPMCRSWLYKVVNPPPEKQTH